MIEDYNYNNHRVTNTTNYMHKIAKRLGLWRVEDLGPSDSKGKFLKSKRN